ncbi:integrin beta-PS-like [Pieris napi]|uniref:integrin beta-PS-like n=1 Tax=Pieris napi TaxID=78633 RepID=UPI001FB8A914|nr:integrin beta-PS-like [Pieris napi]
MKVVFLICLYLKLNLVYCESNCKNFKTCSGCIGYNLDKCVWCSAKEHDDRRCQTLEYAEKNNDWCKENYYNPPEISSFNVVQNDTFNVGLNGAKVVQFTPQILQIKARPNALIPFKMKYKPAKDYPLDIYYVMDYSATMKKHTKTLIRQANKIYEELTRFTNNVRFGIGSYVEKPAMPFVDLALHKSYSFKNHLSLTDDVKLFIKNIGEPDGSNYDDPEAAFDALMQAMVCKDNIDWRNNARRIIVLCTDGVYHSAGDGKFVGAIKPNDMKCHLDNNTYSEALTYDYPSVSQINKIATENNIKIIFAVDPKVQRSYEALEKKILGAKYVPLTGNIVDMIINEYLGLVRSVVIDSNIPRPIQLAKIVPDCTKSGICEIKHEQSLEMEGFLKINSCPSNEKKMKYSLEIGPVSLDEKLKIELEIDCHCDCEAKGEMNSTLCSGAGIFQCGVCKCNDDRYGSICDCKGTDTNTINFDKCKANVDDANYCSGRGICRCGKCEECKKGFSGDFCQFDDNACPRPGGLLCSGHGRCQYGTCACEPKWIGDDCRCPDDEHSCMAPISNEVCSGRGQCKCGECVCQRQNGTTEICSGKFCDDCEELTQKRCKELEDYALCNFYNNKTKCDEEYNQTTTGVILVNKTEMHAPGREHKAKWCHKALKDDKTLTFLYYYPIASINTLEVVIQNELDERAKANIWVAVGSAIGGVLLIGLLMVIGWKLLIDAHDKREYNKLIKESAAAGYDVSNPLYRTPAVNFSNPAYDRRS